jgi:hypothetical protein
MKVTMFALDTRRDGCSRPLPLGVPRAMSIWRLKKEKCNKKMTNFKL